MAPKDLATETEELAVDADFVCQQTLKSSINCSGVALHSGKKVSLTLKPADADTGVVFRRTDIAGRGAEIKASYKNVVDTRMCTVLGNEDGVTVGTVEHLMAALAGCHVDNVIIEINGPEVPIMDGSSEPFVFLIECAGIERQDAPRKVIRIKKAVEITDGDLRARLQPGTCFSVDFDIDFESQAVARQHIEIGLINGTFKREISRARTFGFLHQVEALRAAGLAQGGSLENAVVVSGDKILNEDGLRFDDEFVRHKVLDAVGDLYLAGAPIIGGFQGCRTGHAFNNKILHALFADPDAWCYDTIRVNDPAACGKGGVYRSAIGGQVAEAVA